MSRDQQPGQSNFPHTRRDFLKTSAAATAASFPFWFATNTSRAAAFASPNERPLAGSIGTGSRWQGGVAKHLMKFADCVAVCDVDKEHAAEGVAKVQKIQGSGKKVDAYGDYRRILDRKDIQVVTIATPDHWHTRIAIEAMKAGKDIYCEKPLTLTIDEGKQIIKVLNETNRVFQVGTQQRSEMNGNFLTAVAMVRDGRIGKVKRTTCYIGIGPSSGPLKKESPPSNLDWNTWLGQAPKVDYIPRRCHYEFRWWYEYSGGKLTDWGAHHMDIAQWAIGMDHSGPAVVEPLLSEFPVPYKNGYATVDNQYNTPTEFRVRCGFANGVDIYFEQGSDHNNGILFEGTEGYFHVARPSKKRTGLKGPAVDELKNRPIPQSLITQLYKGKQPGEHMGNFIECVKTRELPISDVYTHHRAVTTCHLANIALRLNRTIHWDPKAEQITGDSEARTWQSREQRRASKSTFNERRARGRPSAGFRGLNGDSSREPRRPDRRSPAKRPFARG